MTILNEKQQVLLRKIPSVDSILEAAKKTELFENTPRPVLVYSIREAIERLRIKILNSDITDSDFSEYLILEQVSIISKKAMSLNLKRVINATGVVVHTNLGRSLLPKEATQNLVDISSYYSNLEFDISLGERGSRYSSVEGILCELTGAPSAIVVNNNAAAVFLCLDTIAKGKKVIVSRGELVEIGGSFRIPDVMVKSGCILTEVGTTNRTHLKDYEKAVDDETILLLKVHTSNYSIVGFTSDVPLKNLVELGRAHKILVMEDLGSGTLIDFSDYGLQKEPTVCDAVKTGADIITFSGDKLLGGPQAGIIVGGKDILDKIKKNPLTRALRIDKLTLSALESTLNIYRDPKRAVDSIPTLKMLLAPIEKIENKAKKLYDMLVSINNSHLNVKILNLSSKAGGGALPLMDFPSKCVGIIINGLSANYIEEYMRKSDISIIGRIEDDIFIMDLRTIFEEEFLIIQKAVKNILKKV
ncbi:MAG: L-seryl-tRNA(Sec) selenium transferase [Desulfobacterales bacterium]|nr:L-seryl-tRNA(Sec) selenium transferase [Desulfobacterales bacterium]MBF0398355.1 L-seryl-tRNA(Sec) selenium transferase [Desulfobacterales bacterium]